MLPPVEDFSSTITRLFKEQSSNGEYKRVLTYTFQVTTDCSLRCSYCYQINKSHDKLSFDTAKKAIDYIFDNVYNEDSIFSYDRNLGIVFDFIGGEPLLEIDLVVQIIEYIERKMIEFDSPWLLTHRYSFSSNGVAYFDPRVQDMLNKYGDLISMAITVDGNKELHDKCRLFPDGSGSYDLAVAAALHQKEKYGEDATKITLCPENISETANAIIHMLELGFSHINSNCVFEEGWNIEHARVFYNELKTISDYVLDNNLEDSCNISLFNKNDFVPFAENDDDQNWCGGTGACVAINYTGNYYPCLRYMESSLGNDQPPLIIGNVDYGIYQTEEEKETLAMFKSITRTSQSPDKCNNCTIAKGCAWCSAYNYQVFGTPNKRATFICIMHKARALGNLYYWKKEAIKKNIKCDFSIIIDDNTAIDIIGEVEWKYLKCL